MLQDDECASCVSPLISASLSLVRVEVSFHFTKHLCQLSESMMKVSKFGLSSDTSASTKSSMVGRLCSIPVTQEQAFRMCVWTAHLSVQGNSSGRTLG